MDESTKISLFSSENKKAFSIIAIVGFIVFFNSLFNGFVWDDNSYIISNPYAHSLNLINAFGTNNVNILQFYRPLQFLYSSLLYLLFQDNAFFYHLIQVCLHIANTCMVYILFSYFINKRISLLFALLFLVHPINVESVVYISAASTVLCTFFGLLALLTVKHNITKEKYLLLPSIFLLLSLLTKEEGLLYIIILFLLLFFFKKRMLKHALVSESIIIGIYFILRFLKANFLTNKLFSENDISTLTAANILPIANLSFWERTIVMPKIAFYYLLTFLYPAKLAVNQLWITKSLSFNDFYLPLGLDVIFFLLILVGGWIVAKKSKRLAFSYLFFFLWFSVGMLIHMQILPLDMTVADRWFYFPLIGLLGMIGTCVQVFITNKYFLRIFTALIVIITITLSMRTIIRNTNFYDDGTLFEHDSKVADNYSIETNLGTYYFQEGDLTQALTHQRLSVSLSPEEVNLSNLGATYRALKEQSLAKKYDYEAYNLDVNQKHISQVYIELAWILLLSGEQEKALSIANLGLHYYPNSTDLLKEIALIQYKMGNQKSAIDVAHRLKELLPNEDNNNIYDRIINKQKIIYSL